MLSHTNPLRQPLLRSVIQALQLPPGSHGLDAGCGIGLQTLLLSQAVGPNSHITGLDIIPELLGYGEGLVEKAGLSDQITFREGDVSHLPFDDNRFDWAWSLRKWAIILGIILSVITVAVAVTIIPAGVADTLLALPALILLLHAWFGDEIKEVGGG